MQPSNPASCNRLILVAFGLTLVLVPTILFTTSDGTAKRRDVARVDEAVRSGNAEPSMEAPQGQGRSELADDASARSSHVGSVAAPAALPVEVGVTSGSAEQPGAETAESLFEARYSNYTKEQLLAAYGELREEYESVRKSALETKRANRDVVETRGNENGAQQIPANAIRLTVISPVEVMTAAGEERVVWNIWLEPELYPDIYALREEVDWLSRHAF